MKPTGRLNRNGIRILTNSPGYNAGRDIQQNIELTANLVAKAVSHGSNPLTPRYVKRVPPWFR